MLKSKTTTAAILACAMLALPMFAQAAEQPDVMAKVGETTITKAEVLAAAAGQLAELRQQEYEILSRTLNELVDRALLAAAADKKGQSLDEYFATEIEAKVSEPTDAEVSEFYEKYKSRLRGQSLETAKPQIVARLKQLAAQEVYAQLIGTLKAATPVSTMLEPPRIDVAEGDNPSWGPKDAPVTIIEFSDYECPYCARAELETIAKVRSEYEGKVRIVFRDFPLNFHKNAQKAHEAAACAREQGKFWEMHETLFNNRGALGVDKLYAYATEIGLDEAQFKDCLDTGKFAAAVQEDLQAGVAAGVSGTPAFFINGRLISGAQPFSAFAEIIDEELAR